MEDNYASGWIGMRVIKDKTERIRREFAAYQCEIDFVKNYDRNDIVKRLEDLRDEEIARLNK